MKKQEFFIDLHCHPAMKPFAKSFPMRVNSRNPKHKNSVWHRKKPSLWRKITNIVSTLTRFSQADFSSLTMGEVRLISASLYPPEVGFFVPKQKDGLLSDALLNIVTGLGRKRINHLQQYHDYFKDLQQEYDFYLQLDGLVQQIKGKAVTYQILNNYQHFQAIRMHTKHDIIGIFLSIEGGHVFNCGISPKEQPANPADVLLNVRTVKNWSTPPLFITLAHHFYNELCGHAASLGQAVNKKVNQDYGLNWGLTPLGKEVIRLLLSKASGKRILIDLKHMSARSRMEYMKLLREEYLQDDVPLVVSHGAVNGLLNYINQRHQFSGMKGKFHEASINFYDNEIIEIAKSKGIFGLQLDERRLGGKTALKKAGLRINKKKTLFYRSLMHLESDRACCQLIG